MLPSLIGKGNQKRHDYLYWEFHEQGGKQAIRKGDWKAVRLNAKKDGNGPIELYDLSKDPSETKNIASKHQKVVKEMAALMEEANVESSLFPFLKK